MYDHGEPDLAGSESRRIISGVKKNACESGKKGGGIVLFSHPKSNKFKDTKFHTNSETSSLLFGHLANSD